MSPFTVWQCPECGERADAAFYGPDQERGHYHDDPGKPLGCKRIFHLAVPTETLSVEEIRERLLSDETLSALQRALYGFLPDGGLQPHEREEMAKGAQAAVDAAFPTQQQEQPPQQGESR